MLVNMAITHKVLVRITNGEDPDQINFSEILIRLLFQKQSYLGLHCLSRNLVFDILEHLPCFAKYCHGRLLFRSCQEEYVTGFIHLCVNERAESTNLAYLCLSISMRIFPEL